MTYLTRLTCQMVALDAGALSHAAEAQLAALRAHGRCGMVGTMRGEARMRRFWSVYGGSWGSGEVWNGCTHPLSTSTDEWARGNDRRIFFRIRTLSSTPDFAFSDRVAALEALVGLRISSLRVWHTSVITRNVRTHGASETAR